MPDIREAVEIVAALICPQCRKGELILGDFMLGVLAHETPTGYILCAASEMRHAALSCDACGQPPGAHRWSGDELPVRLCPEEAR